MIANRPRVDQNTWDHTIFEAICETNLSLVEISDPREKVRCCTDQTGILTGPNLDYIGWEKVPANYFTNMSAQAQDNLTTIPLG